MLDIFSQMERFPERLMGEQLPGPQSLEVTTMALCLDQKKAITLGRSISTPRCRAQSQESKMGLPQSSEAGAPLYHTQIAKPSL